MSKAKALYTDLYQLTMAAAYFALKRKSIIATFEYFVRRLPKNRSFLVFCGLEQALEYLVNLRFESDEIDYIRKLEQFKFVPNEFFEYLKDFKFTGDVWAMKEGTVFFPPEPALYISAPIIEAQIVETALLSILNFQTLVASKAARIVIAAQGKPVADFGTRRAHGPEAAVMAARAAYIAGCTSTSNVEAGKRFGIPVVGTMAHSFVMSFDSEKEAFEGYLKVFPKSTTLLLDTYDTINAAKLATTLKNNHIIAVRLDSGNIANLSKKVRKILDSSGLKDVKILASGDLNEYKIADLLKKGAPIDSFGVGTEMVTSRDDPAIGGIYKLVEIIEGKKKIPKQKLSPEKATLPHKKQVYRVYDKKGKAIYDYLCLHDEEYRGEPLLVKVMEKGRIIYTDSLDDARKRAKAQIESLPNELFDIHKTKPYLLKMSKKLLKGGKS